MFRRDAEKRCASAQCAARVWFKQIAVARELAGIFVFESGTGVPPVNITRKMRVPL